MKEKKEKSGTSVTYFKNGIVLRKKNRRFEIYDLPDHFQGHAIELRAFTTIDPKDAEQYRKQGAQVFRDRVAVTRLTFKEETFYEVCHSSLEFLKMKRTGKI